MIRVAVLDDHAAVRAGLEAILGAAPEMVSVGSAHDEAQHNDHVGASGATVADIGHGLILAGAQVMRHRQIPVIRQARRGAVGLRQSAFELRA